MLSIQIVDWNSDTSDNSTPSSTDPFHRRISAVLAQDVEATENSLHNIKTTASKDNVRVSAAVSIAEVERGVLDRILPNFLSYKPARSDRTNDWTWTGNVSEEFRRCL